jgi:hypothetical protein
MGKALGCGVVLLRLLLAVVPAALAEAVTRADFPPGFVFGVGSSAYQVYAISCVSNSIASRPDRGLGQIQFLPFHGGRRVCARALVSRPRGSLAAIRTQYV